MRKIVHKDNITYRRKIRPKRSKCTGLNEEMRHRYKHMYTYLNEEYGTEIEIPNAEIRKYGSGIELH
jgi:hypothetical protein